jgi:hypothetical protein
MVVYDLSQPLHNTLYNSYNRKYHQTTDGIINHEVLDNLHKIKIYPIKIKSEKDLAKEIARIANFSLKKGYRIQDEKRLLTKEEAMNRSVMVLHCLRLFWSMSGSNFRTKVAEINREILKTEIKEGTTLIEGR